MRHIIRKLLLLATVPMAIMLVFRVVYIFMFVPLDIIKTYQSRIPLMLYNAIRFDLQATTYIMILPTVLILAAIYKPIRRAMFAFSHAYITFAAALLTLLGIVDLGFYLNFNSHINITLFDFFNEGPWSLVVTFWQDYPVIWLAAATVLVSVATWIYTKRAFRQTDITFRRNEAWIPVCYIALMVVFMRGSVRSFPLQVEDTVVSDNRQFNDIIPNAAYMLKKAAKDKSKAFDVIPTNELLKKYGFRSVGEAMGELEDARLTADTLSSIRKVLFSEAPDTLSKPQPDVVILLCESWSNYLLSLDNHTGTLTCGLERHMNEDLLFREFQSVRNATIATIENITVASPFERLFAGKYRYVKLPTSITIPFAESGYECTFLTGMDLAWENVSEALINQGFRRTIGKYALLKHHPEYQANTIGVYDQHLFQSLQEFLNTPHAKPQMILVMTTTNHPPFDLPENAVLPPLPDSLYASESFGNVGDDVLKRYIRAYQYFNKSFAAFLDGFKESEAAKRTILVATGDHNVRSILNYKRIGVRWQNSVPLYMYLPPYLREKDYPYSTNKYGCHYDIMPTLAQFAFKGVEYLDLGSDLLSQNITMNNSYGYNENRILASKGFEAKAKRMADARQLLLRIYLQHYLRTAQQE